MARLKNPLFSQKAQKQIGKSLIYKTKNQRSFLTKYNKPGGVSPFTPSLAQTNKRLIYSNALEDWQYLVPTEKKVYNTDAVGKHASGWNLFLKEWFSFFPYPMGTSYYGERSYGAFRQGQQ